MMMLIVASGASTNTQTVSAFIYMHVNAGWLKTFGHTALFYFSVTFQSAFSHHMFGLFVSLLESWNHGQSWGAGGLQSSLHIYNNMDMLKQLQWHALYDSFSAD